MYLCVAVVPVVAVKVLKAAVAVMVARCVIGYGWCDIRRATRLAVVAVVAVMTFGEPPGHGRGEVLGTTARNSNPNPNPAGPYLPPRQSPRPLPPLGPPGLGVRCRGPQGPGPAGWHDAGLLQGEGRAGAGSWEGTNIVKAQLVSMMLDSYSSARGSFVQQQQ